MEESFWDVVWSLFSGNWKQFLNGTLITLYLAIIGTLVGLLIGLGIGIIRTIPLNRGGVKGVTLRSGLLGVVNFILSAYIEIFRSTPMMVQAMLIYYGSKEALGIDFQPLTAGILIISLNTGAYMSEIVRGGIQSVNIGQGEACKAIGMNHWQTMRYVILPQTFRNILPSIGNEFIINIKDSSVLNVISVGELYFVSKSVQGTYYKIYQTFFITAVIYFILTFTFTRLLRLLEKRLDGPANFTLASAAKRSKRTSK